VAKLDTVPESIHSVFLCIRDSAPLTCH